MLLTAHYSMHRHPLPQHLPPLIVISPTPPPSIFFAKHSEHGVFLHGVRLRSSSGH